MPNIEIADMMRILRIERSHTKKELKNLDKAIVVLRGLSTHSTTQNGRRHGILSGGSQEDLKGTEAALGEIPSTTSLKARGSAIKSVMV